MSERKLKPGYVQGTATIVVGKLVSVGQYAGNVIIRVADQTIWPAEKAPAECFEPKGTTLTLEVGQWVECESGPKGVVKTFDAHSVIVRDPYGPVEASPQHLHWAHPINSVIPCAPVCSPIQLAVRVSDRVTQTYRWGKDGRETGVLTQGCFEVKRIVLDDDGNIRIASSAGIALTYLWNVEPVNPRTP